MAITMIRDLNEDRPNDTANWLAALAECPPIGGGDHQRWCVAWGRCYAQLSSGSRPLGWSQDDNTDEDGCEWFDSREEAEACLADIEEAMSV